MIHLTDFASAVIAYLVSDNANLYDVRKSYNEIIFLRGIPGILVTFYQSVAIAGIVFIDVS